MFPLWQQSDMWQCSLTQHKYTDERKYVFLNNLLDAMSH